MLLGTLSASILRNILTGKGVIRAGISVVRAGTKYCNMDRMNKQF